MPLLKRSKRLLLLSGTPALARPEELWTQVTCLAPSLFPKNFTQFANRYCDPKQKHFGRGRVMTDYSGASNQAELHGKLKNIMVRRLKADVLSELPPKQRSVIPVTIPLDTTAGKDCRDIMEDLKATRKSVHELIGEEAQGADFQAKSLLMQAYQATGIAKAPAVRDYLIDWLEGTSPDSKILVFCHHKAVMELLHEALLRHGRSNRYSHIRIDGTVPTDTRAQLVRKFQTSSQIRVGILSMTAAGVGLTLTAASTVLFAELHWTPGVLVQCEDRAHRIGQSHDSVQILYMLAKESHSVDSKLWEMLGRKIDTLNQVVDGGKEDKPYLHAAQEQEGHVISSRSGQEELTAFFAETAPQDGSKKSQVPVRGSLDFYFKKASETQQQSGISRSATVTSATKSQSTLSSIQQQKSTPFTKSKLIKWDCPVCTLSNSKQQNASRWYVCAACDHPYDPSHPSENAPDSAQTHHTEDFFSNYQETTPLMNSGRKRSFSSSSITPATTSENKRPETAARAQSPEIIVLDSPDKKPSPRRVFPSQELSQSTSTDVIVLDDSDDEETGVSMPLTRPKQSPRKDRTTKTQTSSTDQFLFSVSPHSERITVHDTKGRSTNINFALEDVLSVETSDRLSEARVQKQNAIALNRIQIDFNTKGLSDIYAKLRSEKACTAPEDSAVSEVKRFIQSYLRLRSVERKAIQDSGKPFPSAGLSMAVAKLLLAAKTQSSSTERYTGGAKERALERQAAGNASASDLLILKGKACAWCGDVLNAHQIRGEATYCTQTCAEEGRLRRNGFSGANIRAAAFALDGGVCSMCGINAHLLFEQVLSLTPTERLNKLLTANWSMPKSSAAYNNLLNDPKEGNFWQVDHIQTVAEGGGGCGMENLRTLCSPCHAKETEKLHGRLKLKSKGDQEPGMSQLDIRSAFSLNRK